MNELSEWRSANLAASIRGILMAAGLAAGIAGAVTHSTQTSGCEQTYCEASLIAPQTDAQVAHFYFGRPELDFPKREIAA